MGELSRRRERIVELFENPEEFTPDALNQAIDDMLETAFHWNEADADALWEVMLADLTECKDLHGLAILRWARAAFRAAHAKGA